MLYLTTYYQYKNKNVSRAAKSVINFVREYNPRLLPKKFKGNNYRGREDEEEDQETKQRGSVADRIAGASLLPSQGILPIEMDRVLTDQDFKKMRKLMKRQQEEDDKNNLMEGDQIQWSDEE